MPDVGDMQEGSALKPDVNEGRLHAWQHAGHLAEIDVADESPLQRALDMKLLHGAVLDHGDAGLLGCPVDQDVLLH